MPACSIQNACLRYTNCLWISFFAAPERGKKQSFLRKFCLYWAAYHGSISVKWPRRLLACSRSGGFNPYNNRKCRIYSVFEVLLYTKCLWISLLISLWITFLLSWKVVWSSFLLSFLPWVHIWKMASLILIFSALCALCVSESCKNRECRTYSVFWMFPYTKCLFSECCILFMRIHKILVFHDIHAYSFLFHLKEHINIRIMSIWQQRYFYSQPCKKGEDLVSIADPNPPPPTTEITENPRPKGTWVFWRKFW